MARYYIIKIFEMGFNNIFWDIMRISLNPATRFT